MRAGSGSRLSRQPERSPLRRRVANCLFAGFSLPAAIDAAVERWMGWSIGRRIEREYGIPRDLPYLTGWVMHCAIEAEIAD